MSEMPAIIEQDEAGYMELASKGFACLSQSERKVYLQQLAEFQAEAEMRRDIARAEGAVQGQARLANIRDEYIPKMRDLLNKSIGAVDHYGESSERAGYSPALRIRHTKNLVDLARRLVQLEKDCSDIGVGGNGGGAAPKVQIAIGATAAQGSAYAQMMARKAEKANAIQGEVCHEDS